ncbi:MAG: hypothetical protein RI897_2514 [Verrucomicrobiota bacterium]
MAAGVVADLTGLWGGAEWRVSWVLEVFLVALETAIRIVTCHAYGAVCETQLRREQDQDLILPGAHPVAHGDVYRSDRNGGSLR